MRHWDFSPVFVPHGFKKGCLVKLRGDTPQQHLKTKQEIKCTYKTRAQNCFSSMPAEPTSWGGGGRQHLAVHHSLPQGTDLVLCCLSLGKWWLQTADGNAKQYSCEKIGRVLHSPYMLHTSRNVQICTGLCLLYIAQSSAESNRTAPSVSSSAARLSYHTCSPMLARVPGWQNLSPLIKTVFLYFTLLPSTFSGPTAIPVMFYKQRDLLLLVVPLYFPIHLIPRGCHLVCSATTQSCPGSSVALSWGSRRDPPPLPCGAPYTAQVTASQHSDIPSPKPAGPTAAGVPLAAWRWAPAQFSALAHTGMQRSDPGLP